MDENVGRTLDVIHSSQWTGQWVTYHGKRRVAELGHGQVFKVVEKRDDGGSAGFDAGVFGIQWAAPWVLKIAEAPAVEAPKPLTLEQAESILEPHSHTAETIDNEIRRLTERIEQLKIAKQVIATL